MEYRKNIQKHISSITSEVSRNEFIISLISHDDYTIILSDRIFQLEYFSQKLKNSQLFLEKNNSCFIQQDTHILLTTYYSLNLYINRGLDIRKFKNIILASPRYTILSDDILMRLIKCNIYNICDQSTNKSLIDKYNNTKYNDNIKYIELNFT